MADTLIREAVVSDLSKIVTLYNLMWMNSDTPLTMKTARSIFEGVERNPRHTMFVATVDDRIVGSFMILIQPDDGLIDNIAVHPRFRRMGVGRKIVEFAAEHCREAGCTRLVLANRENWEKSAGYYEALGFVRNGYNLIKEIAPAERTKNDWTSHQG